MRSNDNILNEAFFKKTSYKDKFEKQLSQYKPYASKDSFAIGNKPSGSAFEVSDMNELKKRLTSGIGVSFANNTIKSMGNKAIKTFPIIVSDNVEPETVVMLKRYLEEQYAEYINLMISNKTIDLGSFITNSEDGNIALQAIDSISGPDFRKDRLARKAATTGEVGINDLLANVPVYNIIRQESVEFKSGHKLVDTLMEDALIVPVEFKDDAVRVLQESNVQDEYSMSLLEKSPPRDGGAGTLERYLNDRYSSRDKDYNDTFGFDKDAFKKKLQDSEGEVVDYHDDLSKLSRRLGASAIEEKTPAQLKQLDSALDMTTAAILYAKGNEIIRDRYEKASVLLASNRIAGHEYIDYLTIRLGIPVPQELRLKLVTRYRVAETRASSGWLLDKKSIDNIKNNVRVSTGLIKEVGQTNTKDIAKGAARIATGAAVGGAAGVGIAAIASAIVGTIFAPVVIPVIAGGVTTGAILGRIKNKKLLQKRNKIEGWERVENLVNEYDRQRQDLIERSKQNEYATFDSKKPDVASRLKDTINDGKDLNKLNKDVVMGVSAKVPEKKMEPTVEAEAMIKLLDQLEDTISKNLQDSAKTTVRESTSFTDAEISEMIVEGLELYNTTHEILMEECSEYAVRYAAETLEEEILYERKLSADTTVPVKAKTIIYDPKDTMVTPAYSTRSQLAYGSTEYDRREVKDRKYNAPLVMTVTFRERLSDGKYTDNELTAVIGIQGVVVRVPSEEMKYILQMNAEGGVLKGFLGSSTIGNQIADLMSITKLQKDIEKLPISSDVWHNLEKIGHLAVANKLGGKQSHNISNAHIIFSQKEIDEVRNENGIDYLKDKKLAEQLMKKYSAFSIMIVSDPAERVYVFDDPENISWNVIPYSALRNRDSADQLSSALIRATQGRI